MSGCCCRALVIALTLAGGSVDAARAQDRFDHVRHANLFPTCITCHAGAVRDEAALWPAPAACANCHDGAIRRRVTWSPSGRGRPTNLRFDHDRHRTAVMQARPPTAPACVACHSEPGAPWMTVRLAVAGRCLDCHGVRTAHYSAPDTACATCHVTLVQARKLSRERIARFAAPESHRRPAFAREGHGAAAQVRSATGPPTVAASCATCHARDFCVTCHVDAPEQPAIQALAPDPRATAIPAQLEPPPSHHDPGFLLQHGASFQTNPVACVTCHTRDSCLSCHAEAPEGTAVLHIAAPGRGRGAQPQRRAPPSHGSNFAEVHGPIAATVPASCAACHVQPDCLSCHRPDAAGRGEPGYHPQGFLARHPASAYARQTSCGDCHTVGQFCASCHENAGLSSRRTLRGGYHDAQPFFLVGHGQAARQSLESCVSCHVERDCLTCHSAQLGRRFNPHGPGFDAARLRRKNPQMCTVCHGAAIPG